MLDFIYHIAFNTIKINIFGVNMSRFCYLLRSVFIT